MRLGHPKRYQKAGRGEVVGRLGSDDDAEEEGDLLSIGPSCQRRIWWERKIRWKVKSRDEGEKSAMFLLSKIGKTKREWEIAEYEARKEVNPNEERAALWQRSVRCRPHSTNWGQKFGLAQICSCFSSFLSRALSLCVAPLLEVDTGLAFFGPGGALGACDSFPQRPGNQLSRLSTGLQCLR